MSSRFVIHHDLDGTWSVREKETGCHAVSRGNPVAGLSERVAALRAKRLDSTTAKGTPPIEVNAPTFHAVNSE